jgi:ketosteroid isomerase-like protein
MTDIQAASTAVEAAEARRIAATLAGDFDTVSSLIGDDLHYVHSSAVFEDKPTYLQRLREGFYRYRGLTVKSRSLRVMGDVVLINGDIHIEVEVQGSPKDVMSRYLQVWAKRDGRWLMVSWHSTPMPKQA